MRLFDNAYGKGQTAAIIEVDRRHQRVLEKKAASQQRTVEADTALLEAYIKEMLGETSAGPHLLDVVRDRGMEFIRLSVWNEPRNERTGEVRTPATQGPERTLQSARWVKERNLLLGVDFHYADSWADPGKQPKPRAWAQLPFDQLVDSLRVFTHDYVRAHVEQGTVPDKVAVGNEIINGFLWGSESNAVIAAEGAEATVNPPYFRDQAEIYRSQPGGRAA